jgi:hypothetical protein
VMPAVRSPLPAAAPERAQALQPAAACNGTAGDG